MANCLPQEIVDVALVQQRSADEPLPVIARGAPEEPATHAHTIAGRCERAGEQIGSFARHLAARPLRRLGRQREMAAEDRSRHGVALPRAYGTCRGAASVEPGTAAVSMNAVTDPARQESQLCLWRAASAEAIDVLHQAPFVREAMRRWIGEHPADLLLGAAGVAGVALLGGNGALHGDAFGLAAGTIPPLLAVALLRWSAPSWAHLAEVSTAAAIHTSRTVHNAQRQEARQHTTLAILTGVALTAASIVATVSPAALLHLATVSPWSLVLLGGLVVLAITVAACLSQRELHASPSPAKV